MSTINTGIEFKESQITLKITSEAAYDIACDIQQALTQACISHWVNHKDVWISHEKIRLARLQQFMTLSGYGHLYEDYLNKFIKLVNG